MENPQALLADRPATKIRGKGATDARGLFRIAPPRDPWPGSYLVPDVQPVYPVTQIRSSWQTIDQGLPANSGNGPLQSMLVSLFETENPRVARFSSYEQTPFRRHDPIPTPNSGLTGRPPEGNIHTF
jgi:hypothetical protein